MDSQTSSQNSSEDGLQPKDISTNSQLPAAASADAPHDESSISRSTTRHPDNIPTNAGGMDAPKPHDRIQSILSDLRGRLEGIQDRMEHEKAEREWNRRTLGSGGTGLIWSRPSMTEWDLYRPDAYMEESAEDSYMDAIRHRLLGSDELQTAGRKKVMVRLMEAELDWLKKEDKVFTKMFERRQNIEEENCGLRQRLAAAEQRLQIWEPGNPRSTTTGGNDEESDDGSCRYDAQEASADDGGVYSLQEMPAPIPNLNRVEWAGFALSFRLTRTETHSIDVLVGDPVISLATFQRPSWKNRHMKKSPVSKKPPPLKKKQTHPGQEQLPERIRINSPHILKMFQMLDPEHFDPNNEAYEHHGEDTLVMIRPFKALVYFEDQLRQIQEELLVKHHGAGSKPSQSRQDRHQDGESSGRPEEDRPDDKALSSIEDDENTVLSPVDNVLDDKFTSSKVALEQLQTLIQFIDTEIKAKFDYVRSEKCQRVTFADVWYLFQPGDEVIDQSRKQVYRVIGITSSGHRAINPYDNWQFLARKSETQKITLHCVYLDCDGDSIGPVPGEFEIPMFDGEKAITSLILFPLRYAEGRADASSTRPTFREELVARGRMFVDVLPGKHMHYSGLTLKNRDDVDGQVVIDFERAFETDESLRPSIANLISGENRPELERGCDAPCCLVDNILKDGFAELKRNNDYRNSLMPEELSQPPSITIYPRPKDSGLSEHALTDEDYVIMSYRVFGFILRSRKWAQLDLTHLSYIRGTRHDGHSGDEGQTELRETAFDQLVLEKGHKDMLLSLVAQHYRSKESLTAASEQVDIVRGKGKGLIILLHGAPGVGKTTTAEGVAEHFEKPLFQITCGDLGTTAESVEQSLETNFALASRWGCILLLDEADVFLAKRTQDFIRNGLVSVFLRVLEYYAGILFLTTNRIGDFDEAFGSRIHISLHYPQLELDATKQIFMLNMRIIQHRFAENHRKLGVDQEAILQYVEEFWRKHKSMRWNGRQIRNACQTALALAEFEAGGGNHKRIIDPNAEVELRVAHLETVSRAYLEFMKYLKKLYKADHDRLAQKRGYRARELDGRPLHLSDNEGEDGPNDPMMGQGMPQNQAFTSGLFSPGPMASPSPSPMPATSIPNLQMASFSQGYQQGGQAQGIPNFGLAQQLGGMPVTFPQQQQQQQQQQAQTWQNLNPAMWNQPMLQGQGHEYGAMLPGMPNQLSPSVRGAGGDN